MFQCTESEKNNNNFLRLFLNNKKNISQQKQLPIWKRKHFLLKQFPISLKTIVICQKPKF